MSTPSLTHRRRPRGLHENELPRLLPTLVIAVLGGAVALALALLIGAVHTSNRTTTVVESPPLAKGAASPTATWAAVYARVAAGQVDITVSKTTTVATPLGPREEQLSESGSGFVLDGQGALVTAAHVVDGATSIRVALLTGATRSATVLGKDDASDVAVLHVNPAGLTLHPLSLGSSARLVAGDPLAVVGDPLGFDHSISTGVVSALDRTIEAPNGFQIAHAIQTDAAMNPGNSGGPLLNAGGQVIGIADQIATGTGEFGTPSSLTTSTGVGFAVPIDLVKSELTSLERGQAVGHAFLGISTGPTTDGSSGARVSAVTSGTPAARAGLRAGDVIVALDAAPVASQSALIDALAAAHPGERTRVTVLRGGARLTLTVTLGTQPTHAPSQ